jgi:hypothetical protein
VADLVVYPTAEGTYLQFQMETGQVAMVRVQVLAEFCLK